DPFRSPMIVRPRPTMRQLFFIWKGSIIPLILPQVLFVTAVAALVTLAADLTGPRFPDFATGPFTFLGLSLSLFLGFRNNACYDRWWEARKHYGNLLVVMRTLARDSQILETDAAGVRQRQDLLRLATAYTRALTASLRDRPVLAELVDLLDNAEQASLARCRNLPDGLLRRITALLLEAHQAGRLDSVTYVMMAAHVDQLTAIQGACERIRHTALPFAYTLLLHRTAHIFCILLPFGLVHSLGHATPLLTALVAYTFFGLDALGDELEEPFGTAQNDLPLDAITRRIEIDLGEYRGLANLPAPLEPKDFVLL
ncbi:bestrophin family ion channel, partial [Zoogloea sp.]|uniref:bestrophin family protein n=1 Tax=Zoogloea sp. TaxID=49181 RepID=UPI0031FC4242